MKWRKFGLIVAVVAVVVVDWAAIINSGIMFSN